MEEKSGWDARPNENTTGALDRAEIVGGWVYVGQRSVSM